MSRRGPTWCATGVLVLALTACTPATTPVPPDPTPSLGRPTASTTPTPSSRPTPTGDGLRQPWSFVTTEGARGTFTVPSSSNALIKRIEAERKRNKGARLYYVVIEIDNREGTEKLEVDRLSLRNAADKTVDSTPQDDIIERWKLPSGHAARDRLIKLQSEMTPAVAAGQQGSVVKMYRKPISSISRSFVYLKNGLETVEAFAG